MAGGDAAPGVGQLTSVFMTDPEALAEEGLVTSVDTYDAAGPSTQIDEFGDPYFGPADWDSYPVEDWGTYPADPPPPPGPPWFRNPRLLFGLIAAAAACLVVATVLLITGKDSGEIPTSRHLSTRPAPETPSERSAPRPPGRSSSATPSSSSSAESSSSPAEEAPPPAEPQQPAESAAPPPPAPEAGQNKSPAGPKINVTRTPMSFTPGKH